MLATRRLASETVFSTLAICLERMTYYGTRYLLLLFLMKGAMQLEKDEASVIFGMFASAILLIRVFGGLVSDLLLGTRWSIVFGAGMQALGFCFLTITWPPAIGLGLLFIVVGNALYGPATYARLGRAWLSRPGKMDSAFSIAYISIMIGSFLAPLIIGGVGESWGFSYAFAICAGLMFIVSVLFLLLPNDKPEEQVSSSVRNFRKPMLLIAGVVLLAMFYWIFREFAGDYMKGFLQPKPQNVTGLMKIQFPPLISALAACLVFTVLWFFVQINTFAKIGIGVFLTGIGYLLFNAWGIHSSASYTPFLLTSLFIGIGEALFPALIFSVMAQQSPPKYLATIIGASSIFLGYLTNELYLGMSESFVPSGWALCICAGVLAAIGLAIVLVVRRIKREPSDTL